ncbi:MAG: hypothetical protein ABFC71_01640 [Methanoregula sp.]
MSASKVIPSSGQSTMIMTREPEAPAAEEQGPGDYELVSPDLNTAPAMGTSGTATLTPASPGALPRPGTLASISTLVGPGTFPSPRIPVSSGTPASISTLVGPGTLISPGTPANPGKPRSHDDPPECDAGSSRSPGKTAVITHEQQEGDLPLRPPEDIPGSSTAPEVSIVPLHEEPETTCPVGAPEYTRSNGCVYRAMRMLAEWNYLPARISASPIPVDIIALKKSEVLLVQVIFTRIPIPDAKTLLHHYAKKVASLRTMGTPAQFKKYIMVFSPRCGWKYYEVLPGGLIPAWNLAKGTGN